MYCELYAGRNGCRVGIPGVVVWFRTAGCGTMLYRRAVPPLSEVDRGAGLGEQLQEASSSSASAAARVAEGRSSTAS